MRSCSRATRWRPSRRPQETSLGPGERRQVPRRAERSRRADRRDRGDRLGDPVRRRRDRHGSSRSRRGRRPDRATPPRIGP
jgi:hypothetical protein